MKLSKKLKTTRPSPSPIPFNSAREIMDQFFAQGKIIEDCIENNLPMNINFIDFRAAFNSVCDEYIWEALKHYGLPVKFTKIFQAFYTNTLKAVRVGERQTDVFFIQD